MLKQFVCGVERRVTNVGGHSINILGWTKEQHSCVLYNILLAGLGRETVMLGVVSTLFVTPNTRLLTHNIYAS